MRLTVASEKGSRTSLCLDAQLWKDCGSASRARDGAACELARDR